MIPINVATADERAKANGKMAKCHIALGDLSNAYGCMQDAINGEAN